MSVADWLDLMADAVLVAPFTGYSTDGYAQPAFGADVTYRARVQLGPKKIVSAEGVDVVSSVQVIVGSSAAFTVKDRLTLPGDLAPATPTLLRVDQVRDETGRHHAVLYA